MKISIVIPTFRRRAMLERCLCACLTQSLQAERFEIIVCDDAGEPDLAHFVRRLAERFSRFDVRCLPPERARGPAAARNRGWKSASGDWIAFTDDDCVPSFDWLEKAADSIADFDAAQGRIIVPLPRKPKDLELNTWRMQEAECATANFFCRRQALDAVGGFDERFRVAWREDSDLYFSLLERGFRVGKAPQAVVVHPIRPAKWGAGLRLQRNNRYDALLYKKHPELYRQRIGGPPWDYYFSAACLGAGIAGEFLRGRNLRWALAVWAVWSVFFCARRLKSTSKKPLHLLEMAWTSMTIPVCSIFWRLKGAVDFGASFF